MLFFCGAFARKTLAVAMSNGERGFVVGSARRRRERRLRCFLRHEEMAVRMALARATHHAVQRHQSTQTVSSPLAATHAATLAPSPVVEYVVPAPSAAPVPVFEFVTRACTCNDFCCVLSTVTSCLHHDSRQTDVNFDTIGLVHPQFSFTAVEAFCATGRWFTSSFRRV